jgi:hypothetical protein
MRLRMWLPVSLLLIFVAGTASAHAAASSWSAWQPATTPEGPAHPSIQYRWRSDRPCTPEGCPLAVQIRNMGDAPAHLRCSVYYDTAPLPTEEDARPVIIDVFLKAFGGSRSGTRSAGDTIGRLIIAGIRITGVVVEEAKGK